MSTEFRFDGRVAIITGAGSGLGRSHALLLAQRGAKVVVNDLGGSARGEGSSTTAADRVVEEIRAHGGEAVANHDSVEDGVKIVQAAIERFGRVDIVINNAGILRDKALHKMSDEDWDLVLRVHLLGAFRVTRAAWPHLKEQRFGRVLFTTSGAGLYGNFGQANYAAAKMGLVGLTRALAEEGRASAIQVNAIAPVAASRLTEAGMPETIKQRLRPEHVSPLAAYLCHESCSESGGVFEVGGGFFAKLRFERSEGLKLPADSSIEIERLAEGFARVTSFERSTHPETVMQATAPMLG
jgi:3-hydroxyacyl-CoA dehydrogenase/3a,7a,12a-trihydroxy-5b-cholest-24-enoyl-CoA hydratase